MAAPRGAGLAQSAALVLAIVLALALIPATARPSTQAATEPAPRVAADAPEASLPFASHSIRNWEADGFRGLWVQSDRGRWYYGTFNGSCMGLQSGEVLAFRFGPGGELDRYSQVSSRWSGPCWFRSFKASDAPPGRKPAAAPAVDHAPGAKPR